MALVMDLSGRRRESLRCPKCIRGNLLTSPDVDGEIVCLKCLQCGHEEGEHDRGDWKGRVASKGDLERSVSGEHPIWVRPEPFRVGRRENASGRAQPT